MLIMDLKVDNFYAFKKFHINFSYPKKIVGNTIGEECLEGYPNFRFKKVNIIMGANATGKTSFGLLLNDILSFIDDKNFVDLTQGISDTNKKASFSIDFVTKNKKLYRVYRVKCQIGANKLGKYTSEDIMASVVFTEINGEDSYEKCKTRLNEMIEEHFPDDYIRELEKVSGLSWIFEYPIDIDNTFSVPSDKKFFVAVANNVMKSLDPSIRAVEEIEGVEGGFVVRTEKKDVIIKDGEKIPSSILSSGTKAGIGVSTIMTGILKNEYGLYYCDEKFSYIDSEIEKAVLAVMISRLTDDRQLFFTTHNVEILDMDLPKHSYIFMKKDVENLNEITCISASDILKRNTDSLRKAVENDLFSTLPSVDLIYDLENMRG